MRNRALDSERTQRVGPALFAAGQSVLRTVPVALKRGLHAVRRFGLSVADAYREIPAVNASVQATGLMGLIFLLDRWLNYPVGWNFAYLVPIMLATGRGGLVAGVPLGILGISILAATDLPSENMGHPWGMNMALRTAGIGALVGTFYAMDLRLRKTLELTMRDPLTGALNRIGFEQEADARMRRAVEHHVPLVVAVVDCDRFKQLNDTHGHATGDMVLKALVRTLRKSLGPTALIARTGGDEFVVVFADDSHEDSVRRLRKAADAFSDATLVMGCHTSFSFGLSRMALHGASLGRLLDVADADMYRNKAARAGRAVIEGSYPSAAVG